MSGAFEVGGPGMYHILGFCAVILAIMFIWTVGNYDAKLGWYFAEIHAAVILFFMIGLFMLAKRFVRKPNEHENESGQAGSNGEEAAKGNFGKELFLISKREGDTISYLIANEEKEAVFDVVVKLFKGRVDSIELFAQKSVAGADILITREQNAKEYTVREGKQVLGTIKARKEGLFFAGADDTVCYSTCFAAEHISEEEAAVEGIMTLVTLTPHSERAQANILLIKDTGGEVLGKYYYPLRNLEMVKDIYSAIEMLIVLALAIMADAKLQLAKK